MMIKPILEKEKETQELKEKSVSLRNKEVEVSSQLSDPK